MKTLIKISMMVAVFSICAAFAADNHAPLRARVDTSAVLLGSDASYARLLRVTMKDGSVEEFLVESVRTLTFQANPNDSSNIYDEDEKEDEERSAEPDRTPEQQSSSSVAPSSSSVEPSSSSVAPSSSSTPDDGKTPSSDSKRGGESSDSVTPSSSSVEPSSSSAKPDGKSSSSVEPSSSSEVPDSSSAQDDGKTPSSDSKRGGESSDSVTPSSSSVAPDERSSSSSETPSAIPNNITYAGTRLGWNSRNQTLSVFSRQGGDAKFAVLDVQGVVIGKGNLYVSRGVTSISLDYLDLPKGNFVVKFEIGNTKLQQTIAVTGK